MTSLTGLRRVLARRRRLMSDDGGFSLLEAIVALVIAGVVFSALSVTLVQTVRASVQARQNQNAADVLNKQVEYVRSLDFAAATLITSDVQADTTYLTATGGNYYLATSAGNEKLVVAAVGLIPQHKQVITQQNTAYTVYTFVTEVVDTTNASAKYNRVTVIINWSTNGKAHTKRTSSFITDTRRGLPLPRFTMGTAGAFKTNVGAVLALPIKITNVGAPDAFNLTASAPASGGSWSWYYDSDNNGVYTSTDAALPDSDGNGVKDTGLLQVSGTVSLFAVRTIAAGETTTQTVTLTATSAAQPTASTASQSFSDQVLVNPAACTGCTLSTYYLHNSSTYSDTVYQLVSGNSVSPMSLDKTAPAANRANLYNYSTDCASRTAATDCATVPSGRYVRLGGASNESDLTKVAAWYYSVPADTCVKGTASVTVWVRTADGTGAAGSVTAYLGRDQNNSLSGSFVVFGSGTVTTTATTTGGWQPVTIGLPLTASGADTSGTCSGGYPVSNNKYLAVRIVANGGLTMRLGYDTTTYNAQAVLPIVFGG